MEEHGAKEHIFRTAKKRGDICWRQLMAIIINPTLPSPFLTWKEMKLLVDPSYDSSSFFFSFDILSYSFFFNNIIVVQSAIHASTCLDRFPTNDRIPATHKQQQTIQIFKLMSFEKQRVN